MIFVKYGMKLFCSLLIMGILSGCLYIRVERDCQPLMWQGNADLYSNIDLPSGRNFWVIVISDDKNLSELLPKLADLEVRCTAINTGSKPLSFRWGACSKEERQGGELVVEYDDREIRKILLQPGEQVLWHTGKFEDLFNKGLDVFDPERIATPWKFTLKLEFKDPNRLKELVNINELVIPVVARTGDNV